MGKSGYVASLLAATAATCGLQARYVHAEDLLHGELSALREDAVLVAISWSGRSEQVREAITRAPSATVLLTNGDPASLDLSPDYVVAIDTAADIMLSGIPAESVMETLRTGYSLIADATTHEERWNALRIGHPHGALASTGAGPEGRARAESADLPDRQLVS